MSINAVTPSQRRSRSEGSPRKEKDPSKNPDLAKKIREGHAGDGVPLAGASLDLPPSERAHDVGSPEHSLVEYTAGEHPAQIETNPQVHEDLPKPQVHEGIPKASEGDKLLPKTVKTAWEEYHAKPRQMQLEDRTEARAYAQNPESAKEPPKTRNPVQGQKHALVAGGAKNVQGFLLTPTLTEGAKERGFQDPALPASAAVALVQTGTTHTMGELVSEARLQNMTVGEILEQQAKKGDKEFLKFASKGAPTKFTSGLGQGYIYSKTQPWVAKRFEKLLANYRPEHIAEQQKLVDQLRQDIQSKGYAATADDRAKLEKAERDLALLKKDENDIWDYIVEGFAGGIANGAGFAGSQLIETLRKAVKLRPELQNFTIRQLFEMPLPEGLKTLWDRKAAIKLFQEALKKAVVPSAGFGLGFAFAGGILVSILITAVFKNSDKIEAHLEKVIQEDQAKLVQKHFGDFDLAMGESQREAIAALSRTLEAGAMALAEASEEFAHGVGESVRALGQIGGELAQSAKDKAEELARRAPDMPMVDMSHHDSSGVPLTAGDDISEELHVMAERGKENAKKLAERLPDPDAISVRGARELAEGAKKAVKTVAQDEQFQMGFEEPVPHVSRPVARKEEPRSVGFFGALGSAARSVGSAIGSIIPFGKKAEDSRREERTSPQVREHVERQVAMPEKEHTHRKSEEPERTIPAYSLEHDAGMVLMPGDRTASEKPTRREGVDYDTVRLFGLIPVKVSKEPLPAQQYSSSGSGFGSATSPSGAPAQAFQSHQAEPSKGDSSHAHATALVDQLGGAWITT